MVIENGKTYKIEGDGSRQCLQSRGENVSGISKK
jgi:hypothetical protein